MKTASNTFENVKEKNLWLKMIFQNQNKNCGKVLNLKIFNEFALF